LKREKDYEFIMLAYPSVVNLPTNRWAWQEWK